MLCDDYKSNKARLLADDHWPLLNLRGLKEYDVLARNLITDRLPKPYAHCFLAGRDCEELMTSDMASKGTTFIIQ